MRPETMKAAVLYQVHDLQIKDFPCPPQKKGEVLVRVRYCGVCGSDLPRYLSTGSYDMPKILGHEFMGTVAALDSSVKDFKVGDRVAVNPLIPCKTCNECKKGLFFHCRQYKFLGSRIHGGWAEFVAVPQENLIPLAETVTDKAAALLEPITVAYHCVKRMGVQAGQQVVVLGAGPIGILIAQWAYSRGAEVMIADIRKSALDVAAACGVPGIVDASATDVETAILSQTNHRKADIVIEAAGARASTLAAFEIAATRGGVGLVGRICGSLELSQSDLEKIQRKELSVRGLWGFDCSSEENDWNAANQEISQGRIVAEPLITHIYPLAEAKAAIEMMASKKEYFCKVLLEITQE